MATATHIHRYVLTDEDRAIFAKLPSNSKQQYADKVTEWRVGLTEAGQQVNAGCTDSVVEYYSTYQFPYSAYYMNGRVIAQIVAESVSDKQAKIIDIAAGTGLAGIELRKRGFVNIDALEPAHGMIANIPKNTYGKVYEEAIYKYKPTSISNDSYDCATIAAAVGPGHIEEIHIPEIARMVRPGGTIIFDIQEDEVEPQNFGSKLDAKLHSLRETGVFTSIMKHKNMYIYDVEDNIVYTLKVAK
ncbi:methyltransferase-like protein 27 [Amphiura filiformis]|uniref:methyltransferase-like protein 27 n=1 Tax=Amphiura filiformis TaxID=82378 RepID=UPI003B2150ED